MHITPALYPSPLYPHPYLKNPNIIFQLPILSLAIIFVATVFMFIFLLYKKYYIPPSPKCHDSLPLSLWHVWSSFFSLDHCLLVSFEIQSQECLQLYTLYPFLPASDLSDFWKQSVSLVSWLACGWDWWTVLGRYTQTLRFDLCGKALNGELKCPEEMEK